MSGKYFNLKSAWREFRNSSGVLDTTLAVGKLVVKGASNTVVYTVTEALPSLSDKGEKMAENKLKQDDLTSEQRQEVEDYLARRREFKKKNSKTLARWKQEREDRLNSKK